LIKSPRVYRDYLRWIPPPKRVDNKIKIELVTHAKYHDYRTILSGKQFEKKKKERKSFGRTVTSSS
jgi:hypothetical protein